MKSIKIYLSLLLTLFFLASCEKEIEFNGEITQPLVVVNSFITPDSTVSAHVSESRFFLRDSISFRNITNADVSVWVNGVFKEKMTHSQKGNYKGTYIPAIGDYVKIIVKVPTKNDVSSEAKIEMKPIIESIDTTDILTGTWYDISYSGYSTNGGPTVYTNDTIAIVTGHQINYTLKFKDNANEKNYYRLVVQTKEYLQHIDTLRNDTTIEINDNYSFNFTDLVSGNNSENDPSSMVDINSSYNQYNIFSDELINGKTYSLTFSTNEDTREYKSGYIFKQSTPIKQTVYIYLQSISKDYYLYLKSRPTAMDGNNFFTEAVQIHNNIKGGIGIFGSYTSSNCFTFELK